MRCSFGAILTALVMIGSAPAVRAQTLGASFENVRKVYVDARPVRVDGMKALELTDVAYAGYRWERVDFLFDASGRLNRMSMRTTGASYDAILTLASARMQSSASVLDASDSAGDDLQIRICQGGDGAVTVTYEAVPSLG